MRLPEYFRRIIVNLHENENGRPFSVNRFHKYIVMMSRVVNEKNGLDVNESNIDDLI